MQHPAGMSSAAHYAAPGPVANSAVDFFEGGRGPVGWYGEQSGGGQYQQHGFGMAPMGLDVAHTPVPGHLPSFDKWTDAPLPRGDDGFTVL